MKKSMLVALALICALPFYVPAKEKEDIKVVLVKEEHSDNYYYEGIVQAEGLTKAEMYGRAKDWILKNLKTTESSTRFDESNYSVISEATILLSPEKSALWMMTTGMVNFKLDIQFKDEKYKFRFDNIVIATKGSNGSEAVSYGDLPRSNMRFNKGYLRYVQKDSNSKFEQLAASLEKAIKENTGVNDEW